MSEAEAGCRGRERVRRQLVQGTASMSSILVWGGGEGGAGEARARLHRPAVTLTRTASEILWAGWRGAAGQQGTANRQVAIVSHFPHSASIWGLFPSQGHHTGPPGWLG